MPIKKENTARYPANWKEIRTRILERAGYRCEECRVPHHAVGYRDTEGRFVPHAGNLVCDAAGRGEHPNGQRLTYAEARVFAAHNNDHYGAGRKSQWTDADGNRWFVVVLTIAHVENDDPSDCRDENLKSLCQRCHLSIDLPLHQRNAAATRRAKREQGQPALLEVA
jgi:hypothetical protein